MTVHRLARVLAARTSRPGLAGAAHRSRGLQTRLAAGDGTAARELNEEYDTQAADWRPWVDGQSDYLAPLRDAVNRGLATPARDATVVELGAGAGPATELLLEVFSRVIAIDISHEMLVRATDRAGRVRADVQRLPLPDRSVDILVGLNSVAWWPEVRRVLRQQGQLVWASSFGPVTPLYTTPEQVAAELPGRPVLSSMAGHGDWAVAGVGGGAS